MLIARPLRHRQLIYALIILSAASVVLLPIFIRGFPKGIDIGFHYRWNYYFAEELRQGTLYPRWLSGVNHGYGSPVTLYYPPLQFYVTAAINNFLVHDTWWAISLACWVATALCGLSTYLFSRAFLSSWLSLAASMLHMWAPYHLLELYRGNTLSQYWSSVWVPLVLWAIHRIAVGSGWSAVPYLALSYGLLCLTHVPVAFATMLIIPIYVVLLTREPRKLIRVGAGLTLGLGISAVFMSSVLLERQYVTLNAALQERFTDCFLFEHLHHLRKINLLSSADYPGRPGYLLEIDLAAVGLTILTLLSLLIIWWSRNDSENGSRWNPLLGAILGVVTLSLFFTTQASAPVGQIIPFLEYIQCPDRWLVITVSGACLLIAAAVAATIRSRKHRILKAVFLTAAVALNLLIGAHITTQFQADTERVEHKALDKLEAPQYTPIWWSREWQNEFESAPGVVNSGDSTISTIHDTGLRQQYTLTASTASVLTLRPLYFPGWIARVDGKPTPIGPGEEGHIQLSIPAGEHALMLSFEDTWPRTTGKIISALSLMISFALMYLARRRNPSTPTGPEG